MTILILVIVMQTINIGDIVARKSYGSDILFKVVAKEEIENKTNYILKGICYRLEADALESDLILQSEKRVSEYTRNTLTQAKIIPAQNINITKDLLILSVKIL